jgi:hypothetical protein
MRKASKEQENVGLSGKRYVYYRRRSGKFAALYIHRQCPLFLPLKASWRKGRDLGIAEHNVMRSGRFEYATGQINR